MADHYKRPVSLFYLKQPPKGWQPIRDFRRLPGAEGGFSPQLTYAIRQARERREVALAVKNELKEPVREFALRATLASNVETLSARFREFLEVDDTKQQRFAKKAFEGWRNAIEAKDILEHFPTGMNRVGIPKTARVRFKLHAGEGGQHVWPGRFRLIFVKG
ncbi:hypothetical protein HAP48_0011205 [Bradyrhizobium septentrionale]|uniref:Uncharacterized protein n=1 Tax=Bradyrhizobium septentrionale TaxID=1404411 RepID=A0A974A5E1_9BRAD|nr:hypothetical protein [Bradyrhizobium septentrionale]UGY17940.1 hypothetical protein HAP48_0011205 [Bradyrhizobium septentrionale]